MAHHFRHLWRIISVIYGAIIFHLTRDNFHLSRQNLILSRDNLFNMSSMSHRIFLIPAKLQLIKTLSL